MNSIKYPFVFRTLALYLAASLLVPAHGSDFPKTIQSVKPAVVGVGTFQRTRSPAISFVSTGFIVNDGLSVITNAHGIPHVLDTENKETLGVVIRNGELLDFRPASVAGLDLVHDLAHLRIRGTPLPALKLGDSGGVAEGQPLAFTGFPLGMVLGLNHVTHRASLHRSRPWSCPRSVRASSTCA